MRIAYIVMCHKNVLQINRLIEALDDGNSHFYIHVDAKSTIERRKLEGENRFVLPKEESLNVFWGGISQVKATLKMIQKVLDYKEKYDYVWLISGQDFPIRSNQKTQEFLQQNKGMNFIEVIDRGSETHRKYLKRNSLYYPEWMLKDNFIIKILKRIYIEVTGGYSHTFRVFRRKRMTELCYGSQWWTLTYDCVFYINKFCERNPKYLNHFENTICPDECFFQTIFMRSHYSERRKNYLTYVDWSERKRSPKTLTMMDYKKLLQNKDFYLARKFDIDKDSAVVDKIERYISINSNIDLDS